MQNNPTTFLATRDNPPQESFFPKNVPFIGLIQTCVYLMGTIFPKFTAQKAFQFFGKPLIKVEHKKNDTLLDTAKIVFYDYKDFKLAGYEWGSGDKVILLVHGWASRGTALRSFVPELLYLGYKVVAMDGPTHGNSGGKSTNIEQFAGAQKVFYDHYNIVGTITHSFGGITTMYMYKVLLQTVKMSPLVMISLPRNLKNILPDFRDMLHLPTKSYHYLLKDIFRKTQKELSFFDLENQLNPQDPIMIIHDVDDQIVSVKRTQNIQRLFPLFKIHYTKGFGHFKLVKNNKVIKATAQFLDQYC